MKKLAVACVLALLATPVAAQVQGRYTIEGTSSGNTYTGTVNVTKTGETYRVEWRVGDERYVGTAIGDDQFLAVAFTSSGQGGVALFGRDGEGWKGVWTFNNGRKLEPESWKKAK